MREQAANYMDESLSEIEGVRVLPRDPRHEKRALYRYIFAIDPPAFGATNKVVARAMQAEGIPCWTGYDPMYRYDLFRPNDSRLAVPSAFPEYFDLENMHLPVTERISAREGMWLDEEIFRDGEVAVDEVVSALKKVQMALASDASLADRIRALD
ncbi:MAG: DegT/DnrJ/EryC1/StrS family aminotransferase, partial [Anaerolineae bacterium]|nr:DegT/DnrJ/EryC1/StrS family aminotransferase [Anaerolineae bacterium]